MKNKNFVIPTDKEYETMKKINRKKLEKIEKYLKSLTKH